MVIPTLEDYVEITAYLLNQNDPRYMRVLWLQDMIDWSELTEMQILSRRLQVENREEPVLMLDNSVIGMN